VTAEQQRWVEVERVADRPEVELRIVAPPRQEAYLAEVLFPAATPLPEAKEYIYRELQELTVQAAGAGLRWLERPGQVVLDLSGGHEEGSDAVALPLEAGVREVVGTVPHACPPGGAPWHTCRLEFDREAGWDRARAEGWAQERLGLRDLGRTALLTATYRSRAGLAHSLSELLFEGACRPAAACRAPGAALDEGCPVEFVAVPPLEREGTARRASERESRWGGGGTATAAPRQRARGGAGLEIDLAAPRQADDLPAEVRAALPAQGLVNYAEARAVVQALASLVSDKAFQAASADWQCQHGAACEAGEGEEAPCSGVPALPAVAVMALYPAQAELIRALLRRAPEVRGVPVEVGLPADFRQRECLVALVSLTRSHTHRAVSYGEGPHELVRALTRPVARLMLFGDLGTLARRSQWQAPLDHLDEAASRREHGLVARLVARLQDHGPQPRAIRLQESSA
jgi:hypothetical protein